MVFCWHASPPENPQDDQVGQVRGAAVTVLLVVVWIGLSAYAVGWTAKSGTLSIDAMEGAISIKHSTPVPFDLASGKLVLWRMGPSGFVFGEHRSKIIWRPDFSSSQYRWGAVLPLWLPPVVTGSITFLAWRLDTLARRRAKLNLCPTGGCGYDRTGLAASAKCPECGAAP